MTTEYVFNDTKSYPKLPINAKWDQYNFSSWRLTLYHSVKPIALSHSWWMGSVRLLQNKSTCNIVTGMGWVDVGWGSIPFPDYVHPNYYLGFHWMYSLAMQVILKIKTNIHSPRFTQYYQSQRINSSSVYIYLLFNCILSHGVNSFFTLLLSSFDWTFTFCQLTAHCSRLLMAKVNGFEFLAFVELPKVFLLCLVNHSENTSDWFPHNPATKEK